MKTNEEGKMPSSNQNLIEAEKSDSEELAQRQAPRTGSQNLLEAVAELLEGFSGTVGVTPFVVVPTANLNHVATDNIGEAGVKDAGVRIGNDVLKNKVFFAVSKDTLKFAFSSLLHSSVNFFNRYVLLEDSNEVGQGTGRSRNAEGSTVEEALELRNNFTDSLSSTRGGWDDVDSSGTSATWILVRKVKDTLVVGVGVDRAHHALFDSEVFFENLNHWGEAVGGAGCVRNDVVLGRIVFLVVDAKAEGEVRIGSRCRDENLLGAGFNVLLSSFTLREKTSGFKNDVHVEFLPRKVGWVAFNGNEDLVAVDNEVLAVDGDFTVELALGRVVLEEVSDHFDRGEVVDSNNLSAFFLGHSAKNVTSDTTETIDSVISHKTGSKMILINVVQGYRQLVRTCQIIKI
jgi:hypothetical protein